jgi:hypothetical protein
LNRGRREDLKHVIFFKFGGVSKLRHGGATTGHRAGNLVLAGEDGGWGAAVCSVERRELV